MKKISVKILSCLICALFLCAGLCGCFLFEPKPDGGADGTTEKAVTPEVTVSDDGVAEWNAVEGALYYIYVIDDGEEKPTADCSVQLEENQTIKVKTVSSEDGVADSDFSEPVKYVKGSSVQTKLATPQVSIDGNGLASWSKVAHADKYIYVLDNGAEKTTVSLSVQLTDSQTIKVKAASNDTKYLDSNFSQSQTYVKPPVTHTHTDADKNGVCDECKESVMAELSFYAVNDLHGKFMDTSTQPGLDEFTTYLKNLYADNSREEILLSSGDMWQGTVESSSNKGRLMTEWMNEVGFSSMTLGNHEYDWGPQTLTPNSELAEFPFLAINVTYNGKAVDYCRASTTVEKGGVKIGIIGAIGDCLSSISGEFKSGLSFATGSALTSLVKTESNRLRTEEGCDFIVYSIHDGGESFSSTGINSVTNNDISYYDTSLSNGYVDLVFEAHTHQRYILQDEYGVYHLQGSSENRYLSCAEVSYNTVTAEYRVTPKHISNSVYASSSIKDDPVVEEIFNKYFPDDNPYVTIGYNASTRDSTAICEKVAELYYEKGVKEWGSQCDIVLGGGYLKARNPYNVYAGNVSYADLFSVLPFDNDIVLGKIKGTYLKSKFLNNSSYTKYATVSSSSVTDSSYYYIVVDTYTSTYKSNNITEVARLSGTYARDLLAEFVSGGGWGGY